MRVLIGAAQEHPSAATISSGYDSDPPRSSAALAPRSPMGFSFPTVVSLRVCRSSSALISAPRTTENADRRNQASTSTMAATDPYAS